MPDTEPSASPSGAPGLLRSSALVGSMTMISRVLGLLRDVVIAAFVMGLVTFGLGLLNVPGIVMSIVIGVLLISVIALPRLWSMWRSR